MKSFPSGSDLTIASLQSNDLFLARCGFVPLAFEYLEKVLGCAGSRPASQVTYGNFQPWEDEDFNENRIQGRILAIHSSNENGIMGNEDLDASSRFAGVVL
jgi:hypothetical protein